MQEETTYRFGPLERNGFILGLRVPQLVVILAFGALGVFFLNVGGAMGLLLALASIGAGTGLAMTPIRGHTVEEWTPLMIRFFVGRWSKKNRFRAQMAQVGHIVRVPDGGLTPEPIDEAKSVPAELAGLEFLETELAGYEGRALMGAIKDKRAGTFTGVLRCQGQAFALLGGQEREGRLAQYGGVLAALARDDSPLRRVAWIERTLPADGDAMADYLMDAKRPDDPLENPSPELVSYLRLLDRAGDVAEDHELLLTLTVDVRKPAGRRAVKNMGGGDLGALAVLAGEVEHTVDLLEGAGISVSGILTRRGLAASIRNAYDPWGRRDRERSAGHQMVDEGISVNAAGPMARDEAWDHIATDGAHHATSWIAEWPRIDVRALFMQPLLMESQATRTVAMVMDLVGPGKAIRAVEKAATETLTERSMRTKIGQRTTQRQAQKESAVARRERELAQGHAEVRFAGYVTVSVPADQAQKLPQMLERVGLAAKRAPLTLERMWGQQAEAFTYTLPLGRGLR